MNQTITFHATERHRVRVTLDYKTSDEYHPMHLTRDRKRCFPQRAFGHAWDREVDGRPLKNAYTKFAVHNIGEEWYSYKATQKGRDRYNYVGTKNTDPDDLKKIEKMTQMDWCAYYILFVICISYDNRSTIGGLRCKFIRLLGENNISAITPVDPMLISLDWGIDHMAEILEWMYTEGLIT